MNRFLALREENLRKHPSLSEFMVWLRVLSLGVGTHPEKLVEDLSKLPYLNVLLKDHRDFEDLKKKSQF